MASNRFFPVGARGQTGKARVTFVIDRSGTLISRALAESAGSRSLDDAALAIIARAEPFPAPPSELKEDSFPFTVQIVFSDRQFQVPPLGVVLSRPDPASTEADPMAPGARRSPNTSGATGHFLRRRSVRGAIPASHSWSIVQAN
ncbi:energy transducer TonB family protein [Bradyrhizobium japonicum]|uniref:energy transducer TonB family protein n=1 Tax=Bradyrhizobium japonicum TaxID=375 RepID=UPI001F0B2967|nr:MULTISPECIES: energy transducer TonB [Bradyrhizobium]MDI2075322.1 energy transducer TonB [Bradyrhizobium sp. Mp27]